MPDSGRTPARLREVRGDRLLNQGHGEINTPICRASLSCQQTRASSAFSVSRFSTVSTCARRFWPAAAAAGRQIFGQAQPRQALLGGSFEIVRFEMRGPDFGRLNNCASPPDARTASPTSRSSSHRPARCRCGDSQAAAPARPAARISSSSAITLQPSPGSLLEFYAIAALDEIQRWISPEIIAVFHGPPRVRCQPSAVPTQNVFERSGFRQSSLISLRRLICSRNPSTRTMGPARTVQSRARRRRSPANAQLRASNRVCPRVARACPAPSYGSSLQACHAVRRIRLTTASVAAQAAHALKLSTAGGFGE